MIKQGDDRVIDTLPGESAAVKIIYLRVTELNEKWSHWDIINARIRSWISSRKGILNLTHYSGHYE